MIELCGVYKSIGGRPALHDVSLNLTGGCVALVGSNGSGKTTLLRLLATLTRPDTGQMFYDGDPYSTQILTLRQSMGYLPQIIELSGGLTPRGLLRYLAQIRRVADPARAEMLLSRLKLSAFADRPLNQLSGGQLRLVCFAQALVSQPEILLLDEVFSGLGIEERQAAAHLFTASGARLCVFSTHDLDEAERIATHLLILHRGSVCYYGSIDALRRIYPADSLERIYIRLIGRTL